LEIYTLAALGDGAALGLFFGNRLPIPILNRLALPKLLDAAMDALLEFSGEFALSTKQASKIIIGARQMSRSYTKYATKAGIPAEEQHRFRFITEGP
jgi:hypothetical protein